MYRHWVNRAARSWGRTGGDRCDNAGQRKGQDEKEVRRGSSSETFQIITVVMNVTPCGVVATFSGLLPHRQRHISKDLNLYNSNHRRLYHLSAFVHFLTLREAVEDTAASVTTVGNGARSSIT